ncbi:MAG: hypothetical protein GXP62_15955 [Oligoflexia bacterium]|nr:hypothetical protein [Oligoflexia bacterium]
MFLACGLPATQSDLKFGGVGQAPAEIGAAPTPGGGLIEYDWVEFAGGQLPLALVGQPSFAQVGPALAAFAPPYAIVMGSGLIFDTDQPDPDALYGHFARPPDTVGTCHTVYGQQSYAGDVADVGSAITAQLADGSAGFEIGRHPFVLPPDVQDVRPRYSALATWRSASLTHWVPTGDGNALSDAREETLARANYPFGQTLNLSFPGGLPPIEAAYPSVPLPLRSVNLAATLTLPQQPAGFMLEWTGPRFDARTRSWTGEGQAQASCLAYGRADTPPASPTDCQKLPLPPSDGNLVGQIYTGPWKTESGLTLRWEAQPDATDSLSVSIRFLARVDQTDARFVRDVVSVDADSTAQGDWDSLLDDGLVPGGTPVPQGQRPSLACDDDADVSWVFDPALRQADNSPVPTLQGDPQNTVAEFTCTLDPGAGSFTITAEMLGSALSYADQHQAGGAVFYVARTQSEQLEIPAVRDWAGQRHDVSPVTVVSQAVQIGRFWYDR